MAKIRGWIYAFICALSILFIVILFKIAPKKNWKFRRKWAKLQRFLIGYKLIKSGEFEDADMIMINHKSMLDIIILEEIYPKNLAWIAKKEIGEMRVFGEILKTPKMIAVDRKNPRSIVKLIKDAKDRVENGRVLAIFPEGTRGRGDKLLKFHTGAKVLAEKLNLKVQPIVLKDTLYNLDVKKVEVRSSDIKITCLPLCDLSDPEWFVKARKDMQKAYDEM